MQYKKIVFIPVILAVMILSLFLVKQNQETRRGAAGTAKAVLIMSPEQVSVSVDDKFDVNVVVSVEATMSATKLLVCHSVNVELEKQETELASFNVYENKVSDQNNEKCSEIVMTGMTMSDKLPSQYFKLIKMGFVAKSSGIGVVKIIGENSKMVGVGGEIAVDTDINSVTVDVGGSEPTGVEPTGVEPTGVEPTGSKPTGGDVTIAPTSVITIVPTGSQPTGVVVTQGPNREWWTCNSSNTCIIGTNVCNSASALAGKCFYGTECPADFCGGLCQKCEGKVANYKGPDKGNGDYNCDGRVDGADYVLWRNEFIDKNYGERIEVDGNCDMKVTVIDYSIWREWYLNY